MQPLNQQQIQSYQLQKPQAEIGYRISDTQEEEKRALYLAFELVREAKRIGANMRAWAEACNIESKSLLIRLQKKAWNSAEKQLWELSCMENKVLVGLRTYMNEVSTLLNGLKPLNPPLRTDQIKAFAEAIATDRRTTVDAMESLTKTSAQVTAYKLDLQHNAVHPNFGYNPPA